MDLNLSVFQEPRGVMRILHFVFSICAFATISGFEGTVKFRCDKIAFDFPFDYPFNLFFKHNVSIPQPNGDVCNTTAEIVGNFSSDAKFFVATGVLAMLYSIAILVLYTKFDNLYKTNNQIPMIDFALSVILAVLWLSSSAAWANGLTGLKDVTDESSIKWLNTGCKCSNVTTTSYFSLNVSALFGFLNFFLWASNLWFLYKETTWFSNVQPTTEGV